MLCEILLSMSQQASQQNLLKLIQSQKFETLKKIVQCFIICEYDHNAREFVDNILNKINHRSENSKQTIQYNTNDFNENDKNILSIYENNFEISLSQKRPIIKDLMLHLCSYFNYWEIFQNLALIDKQWNSVTKTFKGIIYHHGNIFLSKDDFKRMSEIRCIDYRREEDGKFVPATYVENGHSCGVVLRHHSNIINYKSSVFDPNKYCNIMAYSQSIVNQKFVKNTPLLNIKNELVQGKILDTKLKDCYLIYNNMKYFQIRISEWICGIICDLFEWYDNDCPGQSATNNKINKCKPFVDNQPYTSQIPLIVDLTDWCKKQCKNDNVETIYHNLYSFDFEKKKFFKIEKNVLSYDLVLFQYWVHGDFINEVAPFQTHSSVEEHRKLRKVTQILQECTSNINNMKMQNQRIQDDVLS